MHLSHESKYRIQAVYDLARSSNQDNLQTAILLEDAEGVFYFTSKMVHENQNTCEALKTVLGTDDIALIGAFLDDTGVDVNVITDLQNGNTPCHIAAQDSNVALTALFLKAGADLDFRNWDDKSLMDTIMDNQAHFIQALRLRLNDMGVANIANMLVAHEDLGALARNDEGAMDELNQQEEDTFHNLKLHYKESFEQQGAEAIKRNLRTYLEEAYRQNPAVGQDGLILPLEFDPGTDQDDHLSYYKHATHTAWRYLFQTPNPWMNPNAAFTLDGSARISPEDQENILYLWLAASDDKIELVGDVSFEAMQEFFIYSLALLGRAHNWDDDFDDMEADKPSCVWGVTKRLAQSVIGNPITQSASESNLDVNIMMRVFKEQVISEDEDSNSAKQTIYSNLQALDYDTLAALEDAMENKFLMFGDSTPQQDRVLEYLTVRPEVIQNLISFAEGKYGKHKIQNKHDLMFQGNKYENYQALIQFFGENIGFIFYNELSDIMSALKKNKAPDPVKESLNHDANMICLQYGLSTSKVESKRKNPFASDQTKFAIYEQCPEGYPFYQWMQTALPDVIDVLLRLKNNQFYLMSKATKPDGILGVNVNGHHKPGLRDLPANGLERFFDAHNMFNQNVKKFGL